MGCFPLCAECWRELSVEERLVYYREMYEEWVMWDKVLGREAEGFENCGVWGQIESAVREGK